MTVRERAELCERSAIELAMLVRARDASPVEVIDAVLERADDLGARLNCFLTVDHEGARRAAREAERRLRDDAPAGALIGVPVSVKDLTPTKGLRTTRGSLLRRDWVPDFDPPAVERLRAAGAIVFAKSNTSEDGWKGDAGNRLIGPTANPWDTDRSSGGSSGGAAAAVAAGIGPVATGTDGAGSVRIPASFCGVVGFKPSLGRVPYVPAGADLLAHLGPLARTVADAALLVDVVAGADPRDMFSYDVKRLGPGLDEPLPPLRIAYSATLGYARVEPEVARTAERAAFALQELGHEVETLELALANPYPILDAIIAANEAAARRDDLDDVRDLLDPGHLGVIDRGFELSAVDLASAQAERVAFVEGLRNALRGYEALVTPTVAVTAFELGLDRPD